MNETYTQINCSQSDLKHAFIKKGDKVILCQVKGMVWVWFNVLHIWMSLRTVTCACALENNPIISKETIF